MMVSLTRSGIPRIIPAYHRHVIRRRDDRADKLVQLYFSGLSRLIKLAKPVSKVTFESIVTPLKDVDREVLSLIKEKFRDLGFPKFPLRKGYVGNLLGKALQWMVVSFLKVGLGPPERNSIYPCPVLMLLSISFQIWSMRSLLLNGMLIKYIPYKMECFHLVFYSLNELCSRCHTIIFFGWQRKCATLRGKDLSGAMPFWVTMSSLQMSRWLSNTGSY